MNYDLLSKEQRRNLKIMPYRVKENTTGVFILMLFIIMFLLFTSIIILL